MKYRRLGRTELLLSEIAVGCSGFWGNRRFSEKKAAAIIHTAFERGVNFFDTGHNYCHFHAEPRLGRIIKPLLSNHQRSELVISSKGGSVVPTSPVFSFQQKSNPKNFTPDYIEYSCGQSIKNLNCDYLDIFQLHGITIGEFTDELIDRLLKMKQKGMCRYIGVNSHIQRDIMHVIGMKDVFDMVLLDYNVLQLDREQLISTLSQAGIGVVAGTILAQGHLIKGKIGQIKSMADAWYLARALAKPSAHRFNRNARIMREALKSSNIDPAQTAFAYILQNRQVASCVFGTTKLANLLKIIEASDKQLDETTNQAIQKAFHSQPERISD